MSKAVTIRRRQSILRMQEIVQAPNGGLRDKPGKPPDYYHTCYCLSGLSASQHFGPTRDSHLEDPSLLAKTDLLCNVVEDKLNAALAYFSTQK